MVLVPLPPEPGPSRATPPSPPTDNRLRLRFRMPHAPEDEERLRKRPRKAADRIVTTSDEEDDDEDYLPEGGPSKIRSAQGTPTTSTTSPSLHIRGGGKPSRSRHSNNNAKHGSAHAHTAHTSHGQASSPAVGQTRRMTRSKAKASRATSPSETIIMTSLESISLEDKAVRNEVSRLGLSLRDVQGDGNCLFRCMSDQLWGTQKRHGEVRKLVCDYLESHRSSMEGFVVPFMKDQEGYEGYVLRMRQQKQFGSHIEIQAAARVFKRNIRVVMSTASFTIPWQSEWSTPPSPILSPDDVDDITAPHRRRTRSKTSSLLATPAAPPPSSPSYAFALAEYIPPIKEGQSMLWLALFSEAEHFQSVRRKVAGDGPAEVEDRLAVPHEKDTSEAARRQRGELVDDKGTKAKSESKHANIVDQVLASLPPGHGISGEYAEGILARVKGDLGEAVEILLEEIDELGSDASEGNSDHKVEQMLQPTISQRNTQLPVGLASSSTKSTVTPQPAYRTCTRNGSTSPANTATTATASRSRSGSDASSRSGSATSGCTTQSEGYDESSPADAAASVTAKQRRQGVEKALSQELEEMDLASPGHQKEREKRKDALRTIKEVKERRRSGRAIVAT